MMDGSSSFSTTIPDPLLRSVYEHWRGLCRALGRLPRRREVDPIDLPSAYLPIAAILVREPTDRMRCELAGARLQEMHKLKMTGMYVDEMLPAGPAAIRHKIYAKALGDPCAAYCRLRFAIPGREFVASDRLYLPALPNQGNEVSVLFSGQTFLSVADLRGDPEQDGLYRLAFDDPIGRGSTE